MIGVASIPAADARLDAASTKIGWLSHRIMTFNGQHDTHIKTGEDYATLLLPDLFVMEPLDRDKRFSPACIPSDYCGHDGREHARQRDAGRFVALCGDIDSGDHSLERLAEVVSTFADGSAWLVYSSAHASPGDMRWRVVLPLEVSLSFADWHDAQHAFFAFMEAEGIAMDHALGRAAQPVYLPNVPAVHAKSGRALRDAAGAPLYYRTASTGIAKPGLTIVSGPAAAGISAIRQKRAHDDRERSNIRRLAEQRHTNRPDGDHGNVIDAFNATNSVASMLDSCGYRQSPRHPEDWRSPYQTGDTFATRVVDKKWISLSASDAATSVGTACASGCYGDAYDLFVHYKHGGDHKSAFRQLHSERDGGRGNVIRAQFSSMPPPTEEGDPGWLEMPDWVVDGSGVMSIDADYAVMGTEALCDIPSAPATSPGVTKGPQPDKPLPVFPIADLAAWAEVDPKPKTFRMAGYVPEQEVTIFPGPGGVGKSTFALQLCACSAAGKPMLGVDIEPGAALYVTAEDDDRENHWRLRKIASAIGTTLRDLAGKLHIVSLRGKLNNELATFDAEGRLRPAPAYALLRATIAATKAKLIVLDNVGHLYVGNENDRGQVTGFINLLYQLCRELDVTIVLIAHPNKSGDSYSGSTAWLNSVRSQIVLERPENSPDPDARVLKLGKANYARPDQQLVFRWNDFAFILDKDLSDDKRAEVAAVIRANTENAAFMACLAERTQQGEGRQVGPNTGPNYAPSQFEGMAQAQGLRRDRLKAAMDRLFTIGAIETHTYRNTTKGRDVTIIRAVAGDPERSPRTLPEHVPQTPPNSTPEHLTPHTHPLRGEAGAPFRGVAPAPFRTSDQTDIHRGRTARGMILAPGETGNEPIEGLEDFQ